MKFINKLRRNEEGATAIEYGLIAALIAVAMITALQGVGSEVGKTFGTADKAMENANTSASV